MLSLYPVFATLHRMLEGSGDIFMVEDVPVLSARPAYKNH